MPPSIFTKSIEPLLKLLQLTSEVITEDIHIENSTAPAIGSSFGTFEDNRGGDSVDDSNEADDVRQMLLLVGAGSGVGAAALLVLLLMRRSEDVTVKGSDEEA